LEEGFVGRANELDRLRKLLRTIRVKRRDQPGIAVLLRGRRRVGKSRLIEVFCERSGVPSVFFQASQGGSPESQRADFARAVQESQLPRRDLFDSEVVQPTWNATFRQLAAALPDDTESIVVIDELPWLLESEPSLEGTLQTIWDTVLSRKSVLFILIGSDLAMMERLDDYERPFHQRGTVMVLPPLSPAEVGSMLDLPAANAIDAYLVTGGLPLVCQEWTPGDNLDAFLAESLNNPTSALLVSGERSLAAEFPAHLQARDVLTAIGTGERTWSNIRGKLSTSADQLAASSLTNSLHALEHKRVVAVDTPLSTKPADKDKRYRIADPYLRFYLAFLQSGLPLVERGRADLLIRTVKRSWTSWRGRAVEPVIREAVLRIAPDLGWLDVEAVGGWWNRQNSPDIDLVGANRDGVASKILFVGRIKWHDSTAFDLRDHNTLVRDMGAIPGVGPQTVPIALSREPATDVPIRTLTPDDLIDAWRPRT
jgi:AAA+ ATPase superfamily predicted ATPase